MAGVLATAIAVVNQTGRRLSRANCLVQGIENDWLAHLLDRLRVAHGCIANVVGARKQDNNLRMDAVQFAMLVERSLTATFLVTDAQALKDFLEVFETTATPSSISSCE
jgi:hypothetical protein